MTNASITIEELKRETRSDTAGQYTFDAIPPGRYHIAVRADGFVPSRLEVDVGAQSLASELGLDPEIHYTEVISVSPEPRDQFESYQPTTVLAGQELTRHLEATIGAALATQPGMAERSLGPGPARPVIRGLDGDRVLILEDGQRMGDLSSQSGDHGVNVNPAAAARLEIVRGPATLLHGASAIGGLVNVVTDVIPTDPLDGTRGTFTLDLGSAASQTGGAADLHWGNGSFALHLGGSGRRSGDVRTPVGEIQNTQSRSEFGSIGLAWTGPKGNLGGSYGYDDSKYGIPFIEEGAIQLTPRRHVLNVRGERRDMTGFVSGVRVSLGVRRYRHDELEGEEVGTRFRNNTFEFELLANHRQAGRLKGTWGVWGLTRAFEAVGAEALAPPVDQTGVAGFFYEEVSWSHVTFQFGGRVERAAFEPQGLRARDFANVSGSVGLLLRPAAANDKVTLAFSLARAARNPSLEELYFDGKHPGNFAVERGNPNLESEKPIGFDVALRWRGGRSSGEVAYFRNAIGDYIFRNPTGAVEEDFPVVEFVAADSVLQGLEVHTDVALSSGLSAELGVDYVRGDLKNDEKPLPRIPPFRLRGGLRYQRNAFQAGAELVGVARQDRVFHEETETAGCDLLKLFASYAFGSGRILSTITARLDNATDQLYRNHLSLIKDFVPEMGRNFKLVYRLSF